jgi:hypothetical protein
MNNKYYIRIGASKIASCIGENPFTTKEIMIIKLWNKHNIKSFEEALKRNDMYKLYLYKLNNNDTNNTIKNYGKHEKWTNRRKKCFKKI